MEFTMQKKKMAQIAMPAARRVFFTLATAAALAGCGGESTKAPDSLKVPTQESIARDSVGITKKQIEICMDRGYEELHPGWYYISTTFTEINHADYQFNEAYLLSGKSKHIAERVAAIYARKSKDAAAREDYSDALDYLSQARKWIKRAAENNAGSTGADQK